MELKISVVIPCVNELSDVVETVKSIRETAGDKPEIIVVDDCSATSLSLPDYLNVILLHNRHRCGAGPSRDRGAIAAKGDVLLFTDAHMRFVPGWYENAVERISERSRTVHCATCLGLDSSNMDVNKPFARYNGATFRFYGPNHKGQTQILEGIWLPEQAGDDYPIPCLMGATYFWPREWFMRLSPLRFLRNWGCEEQSMSLRAWLAGGDIRMMKSVQIGHRFRLKNEKPPFTIKVPYVIYNKLFTILTCLPDQYGDKLITKFQRNIDFHSAWRMIIEDWHIIQRERDRNAMLFKRGFDWFLSEFSLPFP